MSIIRIREHFRLRAPDYEYSANWVKDRELLEVIQEIAKIDKEHYVLDVATGTGIIGGLFFRKVKKVIGIDCTEEMFKKAKDNLDVIICAQAEKLPFKDNVFDLVICRQGLQFMEVFPAIDEMRRVCKPKGMLMLIQLTAINKEDKEYAFKIQMKRQPARLNCFLEEDLIELLKKINYQNIQSFAYFSEESVNRWIDNPALSLERKNEIKKLYYEAPESFKRIHQIRFENGDIIDRMKISIVWGYKPDARDN